MWGGFGSSPLHLMEVTKIRKEDFDALTSFVENIKNWIKKRESKLNYDRTVRANVIEVLGSNQYKVTMEGREFIVTSINSYNLHDTMRILIEQNDLKKLYVHSKN